MVFMTVKLDIKDRRILAALDENPKALLPQLAKIAGVSRQVADYRLKKLISQKTIYSFFSLIDIGLLGYSLFRLHFRLKNASESALSSFAQYLSESYPTFWVAFVSGSFDVIADIFAKNPNEFEEILKHIIKKNKELILNYDSLVILELSLYEYGYFFQNKFERSKTTLHKAVEKPLNLDKTDFQILQQIKANARLPFESIGKSVKLSRNATKYRIQNMEKKGIIKGHKIMTDFRHFGRLTYKIFIKYDNSKIEEETNLLHFLHHTPGVLATAKLLGKWNLDIEIHVQNAKELQKFLIELRNKYSLIADYELIQILEDYSLDFFPEKIR